MHQNSSHTDMLTAEYFHGKQPGEISTIHATEEWRGNFLEPQAE